MKLWLLYAQVFDAEYPQYGGEGRGEVVGACLDGEEAHEVARRMTVGFYREHPDVFAQVHAWELESAKEEGRFARGIEDMDDDDIWEMCGRHDSARVIVEERDTSELLDVRGLDARARADAIEALAGIVEPLARDAAAALREAALAARKR